ncbi:unnamed protein product [Cuscuta campestris]|uniref:Uncharacterized protein n=1 Tax=Cuscuta campestris TaxID=132261 RepID=A0A484LRS5_9ASTE|nr:unnamed protein product [Cuscuta campestris]
MCACEALRMENWIVVVQVRVHSFLPKTPLFLLLLLQFTEIPQQENESDARTRNPEVDYYGTQTFESHGGRFLARHLI